MRRMKPSSKALFLVTLLAWGLVLAMPVFAVDQFIRDKEEGWFWYEKEPEPVEPPKPEPIKKPPQIVVAPPKPQKKEPQPKNPLSVDWFNTEYPNILKSAIDDPTDENVAKYRYATRVMLDKASNFTKTFQRQSLLDPLLDEANRMPFSSAARGSFQNLSLKEKTNATQAIAKGAGLWVFLDDQCPFCALQYPIVARTAKEREFVVTYITPDGKKPQWMAPGDTVLKDAGQSKQLRIGIRPAVALVTPPSKITVLTQGMISQDMLEERILHAGDAAGLLPLELRRKAFPMERGVLTTQDIKEIGGEIESSNDGLTKSVQQRIEKRY